jgi:Fe-S-cluster containining protein
MPGHLLPGDAERIAEHLGLPVEEFVRTYLAASKGSLVKITIEDGTYHTARFPTLVPKFQPDGTACIFLDHENRCTIHAVSPWGCGYFDLHMSNADCDERCHFSTVALILDNGDYRRLVQLAKKLGRTVAPLRERVANLAKAERDMRNRV